jgi:diacylglycerol kinase (ATP)
MKVGNIKFAVKGIWFCLKNETNFRIHIAAAVLTTIAGFYFDISKNEWLAQTICVGLVITSEAINTAIEQLVNLVSPEWNKTAGIVKDVASGAVLLISIFAVICGVIIYGEKVVALFVQ